MGNVASAGSSYPHTGAAIAAAFLRHSRDVDDVIGDKNASQDKNVSQDKNSAKDKNVSEERSTKSDTNSSTKDRPKPSSKDAESSTDISLGLTTDIQQIVTAFCPEGLESLTSSPGTKPTSNGPPDLLAQTSATSSSLPPSWIRSRKVQTEISAISGEVSKVSENSSGAAAESNSKLVPEEQFTKALQGGDASKPQGSISKYQFLSKVDSPSGSPSLNRARTARAMARVTHVTSHDVGVMTPFDVRIVPETSDKQTSAEERRLGRRGKEMM